MEDPGLLKVIGANFPKDANLILGCQVGSRSKKAVELRVQETRGAALIISQ